MQPGGFNLRHGRYSEAFRRKDEENIAELYKSNGFRDVKVTIARWIDDYQGQAGRCRGDRDHRRRSAVAGRSPDDQRRERRSNSSESASQLASAAGQPFAEVNLAADRERVLTYYYTQRLSRPRRSKRDGSRAARRITST